MATRNQLSLMSEESEHFIIVVTKEPDNGFHSYVIRVHEGWAKPDEEDDAIAEYDTNTINLRAATEFLAMVTRKHNVEAGDVYFDDAATDLEPTWRSYVELR